MSPSFFCVCAVHTSKLIFNRTYNRPHPKIHVVHQSHLIFNNTWERDVAPFAHGAMGRRIDPSWGGPIKLFLVPASAPRLV